MQKIMMRRKRRPAIARWFDRDVAKSWLIDSSIIRAHQHAAGGKKGGADHAIGRSRGGLSTKVNAVVDHQGMPVRIVLSQGQSSHRTIAPTLLEGLKPDRDLVVDRGYVARAIIDLVEARRGRRTSRPPAIARSNARSTTSFMRNAT
jgi:hypothetical protein